MHNIFVWSTGIERAVREIRAYSEQPENWYRPGSGVKPPGDNARHVIWAGTIRAVFSWTVTPLNWPPAPGGVIRHLSVSAERKRMPRPEVCWTFAHHFGFTGAPEPQHGLYMKPSLDWFLGEDPEVKCVVIQQIVPGVSGVLPASAVH